MFLNLISKQAAKVFRPQGSLESFDSPTHRRRSSTSSSSDHPKPPPNSSFTANLRTPPTTVQCVFSPNLLLLHLHLAALLLGNGVSSITPFGPKQKSLLVARYGAEEEEHGGSLCLACVILVPHCSSDSRCFSGKSKTLSLQFVSHYLLVRVG